MLGAPNTPLRLRLVGLAARSSPFWWRRRWRRALRTRAPDHRPQLSIKRRERRSAVGDIAILDEVRGDRPPANRTPDPSRRAHRPVAKRVRQAAPLRGKTCWALKRAGRSPPHKTRHVAPHVAGPCRRTILNGESVMSLLPREDAARAGTVATTISTSCAAATSSHTHGRGGDVGIGAGELMPELELRAHLRSRRVKAPARRRSRVSQCLREIDEI